MRGSGECKGLGNAAKPNKNRFVCQGQRKDVVGPINC